MSKKENGVRYPHLTLKKGKTTKAVSLKVKVSRHGTVQGCHIFTIDLPVQCQCGYHFAQRVQVGVDNPIITCPACYRRSYLELTWRLKKDGLRDGDIVEVIISEK